MEHFIGFVAGAAYGATSVTVGQPLDTIKTRMQAHQQSLRSNPLKVGLEVFRKEGLRGLYRGGVPVFVGGSLFRSAQFGVYSVAVDFAKQEDAQGNPRIPDRKLLGAIQPQVVFGGFLGGIARGLIEGPFEYIKVSRQLGKPWRLREVYNGSATTIFRDAFVFSFFVVYLDLTKQYFGDSLGAFWTGALCANAAWLTCWPIDVIKTQVQSGNYTDKSVLELVVNMVRSGQLLRGVVPGLLRSTIANGCSMVAFKEVERVLRAELMPPAAAEV